MVKLINCDIDVFCKKTENKRLVCFGAGARFDDFCKKYGEIEHCFEKKIAAIVDNNKDLHGTFKNINRINIPIISFEDLIKNSNNISIVISNTLYFDEILSQLDNEPTFDGIDCYISIMIENYRTKGNKINFTKGEQYKIPKTIHYCWFGGNPVPAHLQEFMKSWSKFCPNYEIIKWDESNYDITKNQYMKQAYEAKMWAFVSDYARLDIIYNHGGIYLDTDVELLKSLDDLLYDDMFCGFEKNGLIAFGLGFGAIRGHRIVKDVINKYSNLSFINSDGSLNLTPCPIYQSEAIKENGFELINKYQNISGVAVYPIEVLSPKSYYGFDNSFTENTYSIHHYDASWVNQDKLKKARRIGEIIKNRCILC